MFQVLTESHPRAGFRAHRYVVSAGLHGLLIGAAALLSVRSPSEAPFRPVEQAIPLLMPAPVPRPSHVVAPGIIRGPSAPVIPDQSTAFTVPDLSALTLPRSLPTTDDLLRGAISAAPGDSRMALGAPALDGGPATADAVDDPVMIIEQPEPRYPTALAAAGVSGRVVLDYVVDTAGRAEPGSLRVVASSHPAFVEAARASVLASRYQPARLRGRGVRQLVRQALSFRLDR
jgi:TonB family protein